MPKRENPWPAHWSETTKRVIRESAKYWRPDGFEYPTVDPEAEGEPPSLPMPGGHRDH